MAPSAFTGLCEKLTREGGLRPKLRATVEEQVAKTLYLLAHNVQNLIKMAKKLKPFTSTDTNISDNSLCIWSHTMDDALIDAFCHEQELGNRVKHEAADLRTKSIKNYDKLMMLYGKALVESILRLDQLCLKRDTNKNLKRSSTSSLTIEEVDEMISMNGGSLENTEGD
ncbi:hypothetical protein H5410_056346 [Solanum commersonii]|uniref:Uncharacterized protein n=1 Tax=Solanum commersonii TaxID=4109 RepID=A0A9J5WLZ5_SOLCO|nr:hypothetical protein H5410_056346 [Solanum commersonii]